MSFGYSVTDFVALVQLAHKTYRNCQKAGPEYVEIARETRSLHSVLKILRTESKSSNSIFFNQEPASAAELLSIIRGCRGVLEDIDSTLAKFEGLDLDNGPANTGVTKKLWHKIRFGSKVEELGVIRGKLIAYTSTLSVLLDTMQLKATGQLGSQMETGFTELKNDFEAMRKEVLTTIVRERAKHRYGSVLSLSSLSTYDGDNKETWIEFRSELIGKGFRSQTLDKHKDVLIAYMMRLEKSGLLNKATQASGAPYSQQTPWWTKHMFLETINSLSDLQLSKDWKSTVDPIAYLDGQKTSELYSSKQKLATGRSDGTYAKEALPLPKIEEDTDLKVALHKSSFDSISDWEHGKYSPPPQRHTGEQVVRPRSFEESSFAALSQSPPPRRMTLRGTSLRTTAEVVFGQVQPIQDSSDLPVAHGQDGKKMLGANSEKFEHPTISTQNKPAYVPLYRVTSSQGTANDEDAAIPSTEFEIATNATEDRTGASHSKPGDSAINKPTVYFPSSPISPGEKVISKDSDSIQQALIKPSATCAKEPELSELNNQEERGCQNYSPYPLQTSDGINALPKFIRPPSPVRDEEGSKPGQKYMPFSNLAGNFPQYVQVSKKLDSRVSENLESNGNCLSPEAEQFDTNMFQSPILYSTNRFQELKQSMNHKYRGWRLEQAISKESTNEDLGYVRAENIDSHATVNDLDSGSDLESKSSLDSNHRIPPRVIPQDVRGSGSSTVKFSANLTISTRLRWPRKGILKFPTASFPEEQYPRRELVAVLHAKERGLPAHASYTRLSRKLVSPEALDIGGLRYEATDNYVIVLQALSKDTIESYANLTYDIRAQRAKGISLSISEDYEFASGMVSEMYFKGLHAQRMDLGKTSVTINGGNDAVVRMLTDIKTFIVRGAPYLAPYLFASGGRVYPHYRYLLSSRRALIYKPVESIGPPSSSASRA